MRGTADRTVSVVLATYNGAQFLSQQLDSLARQEHLPCELLVSDDGSTDGTAEIVDRFRRRAPFPVDFRVNARRLGYGGNFLHAAEFARGDFLAFCDQDDVWRPAKLRIAVQALRGTGASLLVHAADVIDEQGAPRGRFSQGIRHPASHRPLSLPPWGVFYGCTMVFPRDLLDLAPVGRRGPHTFEHDRPLSHDLWVYFLAATFGDVLCEPRPLIEYRQHGRNATPTILGGGLRRFARELGPVPDPVLDRAGTARHRAELAAEIARTRTDLAVAAARAQGYWQSIAGYEERRLAIHGPDRFRTRAGECLTLVREGGYRPYRRGGLGGALLVKDLAVGLVRAKAVAGRVAALRRGPR